MFRLIRNQRLFSTLLVAETNGGRVHPGCFNALTAAQKIGKPIDVLVLGSGIKEVPLMSDGVKDVWVCDSDAFKNITADVYTHAVNTFIQGQNKYTHVITPTTNWSKDYFPRLAGINNAMSVTDVIDILDDKTFRRPTYAGNAINTVQSPGPVHFIGARVTNFEAAKHGPAEAKTIDANKLLDGLPQNVAQWVGEKHKDSGRPDLALAKVVVTGGRGKVSNKFSYEEQGKFQIT